MPTCLSDRASRSEAHRRDARAGSLAYRGRRRKGAMDPLCGLIGWVRCVGGARRMNGVGEVGARVRVDKLKPWNYSPKVPFPPNPRWHRAGCKARGRPEPCRALSAAGDALRGRIGIRRRSRTAPRSANAQTQSGLQRLLRLMLSLQMDGFCQHAAWQYVPDRAGNLQRDQNAPRSQMRGGRIVAAARRPARQHRADADLEAENQQKDNQRERGVAPGRSDAPGNAAPSPRS